MNIKCNSDFQTQTAYININNIKTEINIKDYIEQYVNNNDKQCVMCKNNHVLTCINGNKNAHHFRHERNCDFETGQMSEWHKNWQYGIINNEQIFENTEYVFHKKEGQTKERRADVYLCDNNVVVEFQHSPIGLLEVQKRKDDYLLHNNKVIWIIDGNGSNTNKNEKIQINKLKSHKRIFLEFKDGHKWMYQSFITYNFIFIDINNKIYKLNPSDVKSDMIDVGKPIIKKKFIKKLKKNKNYLYEYKKDVNGNEIKPTQCNLYIKQQGAGNGKTFGIIKNMCSYDFSHYTHFIIVTKMHSAKHVIKKKFEEMFNNDDLKNIVGNYDDYKTISNVKEYPKFDDKYKKWKIIYDVEHVIEKNNEKKIINKKHIVELCTIDSLMCRLSNGINIPYGIDLFKQKVNDVIDGTDIKDLKIDDLHVNLNKKICLIVDETQDLPISYAKAIIRIMRDKYIDTYVVGDKLQSISVVNNSFTYFISDENIFPNIHKKKDEPINICQRFKDPNLIDFVNNVVLFDEFGLPKIKMNNCVENNNNECKNIQFIKNMKSISNNDNDNNNNNNNNNDNNNKYLDQNIKEIMKFYKYEVEQNNCKPEDFLFVTPFTTKNAYVNVLERTIQKYWIDKKEDDKDKYIRYAIFHKSETGTSINLDESEYATRMVSIHSSKGDGRNIVFVVGLNEQSLLKFSGGEKNLIYESLIHVALTRMKKKLYIVYDENNDDIYCRIKKYTKSIDECDTLKISNKIKYNKLIKNIANNDVDCKNIYDNILNKCKQFEINKSINVETIDMSHHNIRYNIMKYCIYIKIINDKETIYGKQLNEIFYNIHNENLQISDAYNDDWTKYNNILKQNDENKNKNKIMPIINFKKNGKKYNEYYRIIYEFMLNIQNKISINLNRNKNPKDCLISDLCPMELIILHHMIEILENGNFTNFNICELYNIIDTYSDAFKKYAYNDNILKLTHNNCICKKCFLIVNDECNINSDEKNDNNTNTDTDTYTKIDALKDYLFKHHEYVNIIDDIYKNFIKDYPKVEWKVNQQIEYNSDASDFNLTNKYDLLGHDDKNVYIAYIVPNLSELNYPEFKIKSIFDVFFIKNIKKTNKNQNKNQNKNLNDSNNNNDADGDGDGNSNSNSNNNKSTETRYEKFGNKNIIVIFFTLNTELHKNTYYKIEWKNNELDFIDNNSFLIKKIISKHLILNQKLESRLSYNFFKYYAKLYSNTEEISEIDNETKKTTIITREIKTSSKEKIKKMINIVETPINGKNINPKYIIKFFNDMKENTRTMNEKKTSEFLNEYCENENNFFKKLNECIKNSVEDYIFTENEKEQLDEENNNIDNN